MLSKKEVHPFARLAAVAVAGAISQLAYAHSGGHGPAIEGTGRHGGKLAAIISALEADLGANAKPKGVAEWVRENGKITVYLWDEKKAELIPIPPAADWKWILVGGKMEKPEVVKTRTSGSTGKEAHAFEPMLLGKAEGVEVILPSLGKLDGKHVFYVKLK